MSATARLAQRARPLCSPNPGVAALLVKDGRVVSRGWTQAGGRPHAEAIALGNASAKDIEGASLYVTLEPCAHKSIRGPACSDLIVEARPARVVIGQIDPDPRTRRIGIERLEDAGISVLLLDDRASRRSLAGYLTKGELGRPYVTLKLAMSLDGCIAMADGSSQWITGEQARAHVHTQRARHDAILVGGGTWREDQPRLNVRLPGLESRSPDKVVLTRQSAPDGVTAISAPAQISTLEGAAYLYVEGGAATAASFLRDDLVDELHIYRAPIIIGKGLRALEDFGLAQLADAHGRWVTGERRTLGSDTFTSYLRKRP